MSLQAYLLERDRFYNPENNLVWQISPPRGYHSRVEAGRKVHKTVPAIDYALSCLQARDPQRDERARNVIETLLGLQETNPTHEYYGIWSYYVEEPLREMDPPDWNMADFIGARVAQALIVHGGQLPESTKQMMRSALGHAAMAIHRRNVGAWYTNIAIMGAVVCAIAGEQLGMPLLLEYARRRLDNILASVEIAGGFTEYNSPTYTRIGIEELERALLVVKDTPFATTAEKLRRAAWKELAEHFHPGTGQLAGPHSRAYGDWLSPQVTHYLAAQSGARIEPRLTTEQKAKTNIEAVHDLVPPMRCPADLAVRFAQLPRDPCEVVTRFATSPFGDTIGTTWFTRDACIGSTTRGTGWHQQRALIGYWKTDADPAAALRARMLKNGVDLSAAMVRQAQKGPRVLSAWSLSYDCGDFHPTLNRPAGSVFALDDLRLRISLEGAGARVRMLDGGRFELSAGEWRAVVVPGVCTFIDAPVRWEIGTSGDVAYVDAVLHRGERKAFDFHGTRLKLAFGVEVGRVGGDVPADNVASLDVDDERAQWRWGDLSVVGNIRPRKQGE